MMPKQQRNLMETQFQYARVATPKKPMKLADGNVLDDVVLAYETYGTLSEKKDNAILVFHTLTGSHHAAGYNPTGPEGLQKRFWADECYEGFWDGFIGPRRAIDTTKFFVICANFIGGCYGSTGPASTNPKTGKPWGGSFPYPSLSDIVDSQVRLLDHLGIEHLVAAIGGSLGGFLVLDFATRHPDRVHTVIPIATGVRATVLAKAMNFEQIYAIEEDKDFNRGNYYQGPFPTSGLILARIISHKTFVSLSVIQDRARQTIVQPDDMLSGYKLQNTVESYMLHQGRKFVKRFDPNSYLRIINAWQGYDLPKTVGGGDLSRCFRNCRDQEWVVFTINSDVCFYPDEQTELAEGLRKAGLIPHHITVHSDKGHDSFLLEPDLYKPHISYKLSDTYDQIKANYSI